ncbi:NVEALA domain-containing protein [Parabacteroides faecis]|uniref:NVEALA domain-containing protein n=1 Tax=Parabacteroides faecis TaxID=1217282 RepID=UPI002164AD92|nr:NVEALA domain-containing protein [Parabacteroides faecis]MCS2892390.1 NVEALA domain-containing protein [Parabacteroides faecis]UVQ48971.1 NVEALA domain-containing protein [Parabacteroides faecis]
MKKLFGVIAIAAIAAAAGWNFSQSQNTIKLSDLALANIDALAIYENEYHEDCTWRSGHSSVTGWISICDHWGIGSSCSCGDVKYY